MGDIDIDTKVPSEKLCSSTSFCFTIDFMSYA